MWQLKQKCLEEKNQWDPLVVVDHLSWVGLVREGQGIEGDVVGVGHPADLIGVVHVVTGEVGGAPAVDGVPRVGFGGDDDGEDAQHEGGVAVREAVCEVVIVTQKAARSEGRETETTKELLHVDLKVEILVLNPQCSDIRNRPTIRVCGGKMSSNDTFFC